MDEKTKAIKGLFEKLRIIMNRNPGAIKNAQMKWILSLNKQFNNKGYLSPKQLNVLKDIAVHTSYNERVILK